MSEGGVIQYIVGWDNSHALQSSRWGHSHQWVGTIIYCGGWAAVKVSSSSSGDFYARYFIYLFDILNLDYVNTPATTMYVNGLPRYFLFVTLGKIDVKTSTLKTDTSSTCHIKW